MTSMKPVELHLRDGTLIRLERRAAGLHARLSKRELVLELPEAWTLAEAIDRLASAEGNHDCD